MNNNPKMDQRYSKKTFEIQAWRHQNRGLEGSGAGLEASWAVLGYPGRFWMRLGPSWKPLGLSRAEKGGQHGSKLFPKTEPKSIQNQ